MSAHCPFTCLYHGTKYMFIGRHLVLFSLQIAFVTFQVSRHHVYKKVKQAHKTHILSICTGTHTCFYKMASGNLPGGLRRPSGPPWRASCGGRTSHTYGSWCAAEAYFTPCPEVASPASSTKKSQNQNVSLRLAGPSTMATAPMKKLYSNFAGFLADLLNYLKVG